MPEESTSPEELTSTMKMKKRMQELGKKLREQLKKTKKGNKEDDETEEPSAIKSFIYFVIGIAIFAAAFYLTPVHNITDIAKETIFANLQDPWPDLLSRFIPGYIAIIIFVVYFWKYGADFTVFIRFMNTTGKTFAFLGIFIGVGYIGYANFLSAGIFDQYLCGAGFAFNILVKVDTSAAQRCAGLGPETPENTKTGITILDESKFGSEYTDYKVPTIIKDETYTLPLTITNLDEENSLNSIYIYRADMQSETEDKTIKLIPSTCTADDPCNIQSKSSHLVSLDSEKKIDFKAKDYVDVTIVTKYPYVSFGKGEVFSVRSEPDLKQIQFPKPESGPGPVDTIVFFSPEYFLQTGKMSKVKMFVSVVNKGKGEIEAKSIEINRLGSFPMLGSATCTVPGFKDSFSEGAKQEFQDLSFKTQIQFSCDLLIRVGLEKGEVIESPFNGIPFTAVFEYNYIETVTDTFPVKMTG
jgi:hypothetical protein